MLVRAARKARPNAIRQRISREPLYLPWLCPATHLEGRRIFSNGAGSQSHALRRRRNSTESSAASPRRTLATALHTNTFEDIPFEGLPPVSTSYGSAPMSSLRHFDPTKTVMLGDSLSAAPVRHRQVNGLGGATDEMLAILDACMHVGRIERAGVILKRLAKLGALDADDLLECHNRYLRSSLEQIMLKPSASACQEMHRWFEMEMRAQKVAHNHETLAYMLKASLQSPSGSRRERLVVRYMDMADHQCAALIEDILSPMELNEILQICPTEWLVPVEEDLLEPEPAAEADKPILPAAPSTLPEVKAMLQKGLGLKSLRHTLSIFRQRPGGLDLAALSEEERALVQRKLEEDAVESALDRWREESVNLKKMGMDASLQTKSLGARMWKWQCELEAYLKAELVRVDEDESREIMNQAEQERSSYGPFLRRLPVDKLAAVTIVSIMTSFTRGGVDKGIGLAPLLLTLAQNVEEETMMEASKRSEKNDFRLKTITKDRLARRAYFQQLTEKKKSDLEKRDSPPGPLKQSIWPEAWPAAMKLKVGAFLMSALIETAKVPVSMKHADTGEYITQLQPAFSHAHQYKAGRRIGTIVANDVLVTQLKREPVHSLMAKQLPMLVQPSPWEKFNKGGYLAHPTQVLRLKSNDKEQRNYAEAAIRKGDMSQIFKGLDVLGKTSWKINQPVFDVMLEVWNSGEPLGNLAAETPHFEIPAEPDEHADTATRRKWIAAVKAIENTRSGMHSQRCFQNFQLEIARAFRSETFYFPHNIDFRGRAYPIPPYLNHMGADHCRGLLIFGEGKRLGETGLKWLKVHLANVFGYDKASLREREEFAMNNLASITDSARNPLGGTRWWLKAEDPWQCLATCFELTAALDSPHPADYVSRLPVHQDGTCNGLQHYAALGGDEVGAKQVNLEPGDRPGDVYSAVADLVKASIEADLQTGNRMAQCLSGKITRKVVKQTVMTNVYGVTYVGAKAQVKKQLVAAYPDLPNNTEINPFKLSAYIVTKIFASLASMFGGAHDIQHWFGECASRISTSLSIEQIERFEADLPSLKRKADNTSNEKMSKLLLENYGQFKTGVIWTNPLHMPVVQPYRTAKGRVVVTNLQRVSLAEPHLSEPVSKRKQLQAFPPNFIHSLDATHMILSALECDERGLSFAAVHDSFWTHAADIEQMNGVLRDAFVRIHSEDVIGRLAAEFAARYKDSMYLQKLRLDTPEHQKVAEFRNKDRRVRREGFWHSHSSAGFKLLDLLEERKRLKLLASSDPAEVEEGKSMVTAASIYEDHLKSVRDEASHDVKMEAALGAISPETGGDVPGDITDDTDCFDEPDGERAEASADVDFDAASSLEDNGEPVPKRLLPKKNKYIWVWMPLKFPRVPKKGAFDVSRLKGSEYFFS
ncbi:DNA-directed RNA mitochondrial polymerase [Phlyctema vagabunda]|uniref:DNA-directed RNA polymerase n=1 Tax=Phlyctema vagabunda TaxID=108571 RepID=A0ABR4PVB0_9HELO